MVKSVLSLIALTAIVACTTVRPVDLGPESVRPGDILEVRTSRGEMVVLTVTRITEHALTGTTTNGAERDLPWASIESAGRREISTKATAGLVGSVLAAIIAIVALTGDDTFGGNSGGGNDDDY